MNTQVTNNEINGGRNAEAASNSSDNAVARRKPRAAAKTPPTDPSKPAKKSKKAQLVALLSKPNGVRVSVIIERLGWQAHTVRAALSGLRRQGIEIALSKSPKSGETVYAIVAREDGESGQAGDGAAS